MKKMIILFWCFLSSLIVSFHAKQTAQELIKELVEMNAKIGPIKSEIMQTIEEKGANETIDGNLLKQLEDIANAEVTIEMFAQFAMEIDAENANLTEICANLTHLEEKLLKVESSNDKLQNLKTELITKIDQTKNLWAKKVKKNAGGRNWPTEFVEMKVKIELINLMEAANLHTTKEYENLVNECAKFANAQKGDETPQNLAQILKNSHRNLVQKFLNTFWDKFDHPNTDEKNEEMKQMIDDLKKQLANVKNHGTKPPKEELKTISDKVLTIMGQKMGIKWDTIDVYPPAQMSNWQLAMRGFLTLGDFLKIGVVSNAINLKILLTPKRAKEKQRKNYKDQQKDQKQQEDNKRKFKDWLKDIAQLLKTTYGRLLQQPIIGDGSSSQSKQRQRRRRKRGIGRVEEKKVKASHRREEAEKVGCFARVDWSAWLQCISLILLIIIFIWLLIAALIALCACIFGSESGGGGRDNTNIFFFNDRNSNYYSSSNRSSGYGGGSYGYSSRSRSYGRPELTYLDSCSVVWYDLWNN